MKNIIYTTLAIIFSISQVNAQFQVADNSATTINANIGDWHSALKVIVPRQKACAFHLSYLNKDRFYVCAEGFSWSEKGGYSGSDIRLKKNISSIANPIGIVLNLKGYQYNYYDSEDTKDGNKRIGLIAQDVEKVLPGIVKDMPDGMKAISYEDVIPVLIEAIKDQQKQIEELKLQISNTTVASNN